MYVSHKVALPINQCGAAIHQTCFAAPFLHTGNLLLQLPGKKKVIRIHGCNIFPAGFPYPSIPRGTHSCVALPDELNSGVFFYKFLDNGTGGIRGTIINYDHF